MDSSGFGTGERKQCGGACDRRNRGTGGATQPRKEYYGAAQRLKRVTQIPYKIP